ncbi:3-ketodihydrosphingosine reductase-like [Uloborus diversus]|uniref:3-ketodihydrosphingosine reductase-like n=1 Tax=Uloborus diversus TaxID=327109 RepID=UPI0024098821|nr:3-ketodihydrosphingosine reductase-like [Uloborus diversus]
MIIIFIFVLLSSVFYFFLRKKRSYNLENEHYLITGGSSGIGLALATVAVWLGCSVTIVARSKVKLEKAKESLLSELKNTKQKVLTFSVDVSNKDNDLVSIVKEAEKCSGPITVLVNCAGTSVCHPFLDTPKEQFSKMLDVNFLGSVHMTQAVLPLMKERKSGSVVFVSSIAGLMGLYGYSAYSASKFALLGLAESLQMEMKPFNISITVSFPPDTDTPGFEEEMKNKPLETQLISESGGLFSAEEVASNLLNDILDKKFMSTVGFVSKFICTLCSAMCPINSFFDLALQMVTMGLCRVVGAIVLWNFDKIIKQCAVEKEKEK